MQEVIGGHVMSVIRVETASEKEDHLLESYGRVRDATRRQPSRQGFAHLTIEDDTESTLPVQGIHNPGDIHGREECILINRPGIGIRVKWGEPEFVNLGADWTAAVSPTVDGSR